MIGGKVYTKPPFINIKRPCFKNQILLLMTDFINDDYFPGFNYPGHQVKLFSKANNHFQILLYNGESLSFETELGEKAIEFKEWLLRHNALDAKSRRDIRR